VELDLNLACNPKTQSALLMDYVGEQPLETLFPLIGCPCQSQDSSTSQTTGCSFGINIVKVQVVLKTKEKSKLLSVHMDKQSEEDDSELSSQMLLYSVDFVAKVN